MSPGQRIRAAVVYSSRFGTTEKVARSFEAGLVSAGLEARCLSIEDAQPDSLRGYDLICLGAPTEMFSAAKPMKDYLLRLKEVDLSGKLAFAFDTKLDSRLSGSAAKYIEHALDDQGLRIVAGRESALVSSTKSEGKITGADLRKGEEDRFRELGSKVGSAASAEFARVSEGRPAQPTVAYL